MDINATLTTRGETMWHREAASLDRLATPTLNARDAANTYISRWTFAVDRQYIERPNNYTLVNPSSMELRNKLYMEKRMGATTIFRVLNTYQWSLAKQSNLKSGKVMPKKCPRKLNKKGMVINPQKLQFQSIFNTEHFDALERYESTEVYSKTWLPVS